MNSDFGTSVRGLVLSGGGARSAYQVGVLIGISEIAREMEIQIPFQVFTGSSAGSLNASYLAAYTGNFYGASRRLGQFWGNLASEDVYNVGAVSLLQKAMKLGVDLVFGNLKKKKSAKSLLDNAPLRQTIERVMPFQNVSKNIEKGILRGIAVKAVNYTTGASHTFFEGHESISPWLRVRRESERVTLGIDHLMASTAMPILFPATQINDAYFGDGSLRNYTPLSPAIKMGASKVMVIGVRCANAQDVPAPNTYPTFGRMSGLVLNSIILDSIDLDCERTFRINKTLSYLRDDHASPLKPVDVLFMRPSQDIGKIAIEEFHVMPRTIQFLIGGLGSKEDASDLVSNLLFERSFTQKLISLGYEDARKRREDIQAFFGT